MLENTFQPIGKAFTKSSEKEMWFMRKSVVALAFSIAFLPALTLADTPSRQELIKQIDDLNFNQKNLYSAKSPILELLLKPAKSLNPTVSAMQWEELKPEIATALSMAMSGSMRDTLSAGLESLSDAELARIVQLLSDPAFKKFQLAMSSPAMQQRLLQVSMGNAMRIGNAVNSVLAKHNLQTVH